MVQSLPADCVPVPAWWRAPLVTNAVKRLTARDQLTAIDLLEHLHNDLTELEDRFPGIPFDQIYSSPPAQMPVVRRAMLAAGVAVADVELICGGARRPEALDRRDTPAYTTSIVFEHLRAGLTVAELARALGVTESQATWPHSFKAPPTARERAVLDALFEHPDWSIRQAAKTAGVSRPTAQRALGKQAYRTWLAENHPADLEPEAVPA